MGYSTKAETILIANVRRSIILKLAELVVEIGDDVEALRSCGLTDDANDLSELMTLGDQIGERFMKRMLK